MFVKILHLLSGNITYTLSAILFTTATCFLLIKLLGQIFKLYKLWIATRNLSGPTGLPLLGNALDVMGDTESTLKQFAEWSEHYPSLSCGWLGHKLHFLLYDPDSIKELMRNQRVIEKPPYHNVLKKFFGNGLLIAEGKEWRVHRKLVSSVFNSRALPLYGAFLAEKAQELVKEMEVELHGRGFEILHYIPPCTLRMIFGVLLGTSVKFESGELNSIHDNLNRYFEIAAIRIPRFWLHPDIIFNRTALGKENNEIYARLSAIIGKAVEQSNADKNDATGNEASSKALPGLFKKLPLGSDGFTLQEFIYELNTMITGGSHTLTALLDAVMRLLAYHPDIQDKVYEELYGIYGSQDIADRPVTLEDLSCMEYLECVIHECMRLFPPAVFIQRAITKDTDIGSCVLPAGSTVIINIMRLHRNEKYWPEPLKFDPDRFLPENAAKRIPGAYLPFSAGPRDCPGNKYAIKAAKIISATLLRRYALRADTIVPVEHIRLKGSIVLEYVEPWYVRVEERNPRKVETK